MALQLRYRVLAFSTNSLHLLLSWARVLQFGTFIFCISFLTLFRLSVSLVFLLAFLIWVSRSKLPLPSKVLITTLIHSLKRDQNAGRSYSMKIDNSSIERVEEFKYLGTTLTNQNSIQEEIKSRLKLGNACYYSVQNFYLPVCYPKI